MSEMSLSLALYSLGPQMRLSMDLISGGYGDRGSESSGGYGDRRSERVMGTEGPHV